MTPLADALTAAQRSALAALEKAYVAESIDKEALLPMLYSFGIRDPVDTAFLICALDVLREWGVSAPTMTERVAAENEAATDKQLAFIRKLAEEKSVEEPNKPLTKLEAARLTLYVVGVCPRCEYDLTGNDPERDDREARSALCGDGSPREGTEA